MTNNPQYGNIILECMSMTKRCIPSVNSQPRLIFSVSVEKYILNIYIKTFLSRYNWENILQIHVKKDWLWNKKCLQIKKLWKSVYYMSWLKWNFIWIFSNSKETLPDFSWMSFLWLEKPGEQAELTCWKCFKLTGYSLVAGRCRSLDHS